MRVSYLKLAIFLLLLGYIAISRDYFERVRFTLATGIFLYIAISVVLSLISSLWQESSEIDPTGKVVVFSPQGLLLINHLLLLQHREDLDGVIPAQNGTIYYPYQDMLEYLTISKTMRELML